MREFDLIVIGSGSGLDVANAVAQDGLRVAIIEKARMGGTCLNRGCIPSKLLIHSADVAETIKGAGQFGINVGGYIAAELAHFFGSLGTKINIIQRHDVLLPDEDEEVARKFTEVFSKKYSVFLGYSTESVGKSNGTFNIVAKNSSGKRIEIESDQLLVAA